jgi:hypothetical protein
MNWPDLAFNLVHGPHPIVEMYVFSCSVRKNDNPVCPYLSLPAACSFVDLARRFVLPRSWQQKSAQPPCLPLCKKIMSTFSYKCGIFSVSERHVL